MLPTQFLRFPTEAAWIAACEVAGYWIEDPEGEDRPLLLSHDHTFDVLGTLYEPGTYDPETGEELTPPVPLEGFHVNAKLPALPAGWDAFVVTPAQPQRVFAGD